VWEKYYSPVTVDEALDLLNGRGENARLMAGGTDLLLELACETAPVEAVIDISRIAGLDAISPGEDGLIHIGPLVTHKPALTKALCSAAIARRALSCLPWRC
jgi:carbon-monoxide dehydrogenase medium subunit